MIYGSGTNFLVLLMVHLIAGRWCATAWPQCWVDAGFTKNLTLLGLFP